MVQKNGDSRDSENNETRDLTITVNMMHITYNRKAMKGKSYADVKKVTQTQPFVSENKSSHINDKNGENQIDLEKIKYLLLKGEKLNSSRIATSLPKLNNDTSIVRNSPGSLKKSGLRHTRLRVAGCSGRVS